MKKVKQRAITGFGVVLLLVLAFAIFLFEAFHRVIVKGLSMYPTFQDGQAILVTNAYWLVGPIKDKDVVVVADPNPNGYIIKRVYKLAGESVDEVNAPKHWKLADGPFVVPPNNIYVLGDNRSVSEDSRSFGPVELNRVLGKVVVRQ